MALKDPVAFREAVGRLRSLLETEPLIRSVNFHNTPRARACEYECQLKQWRRDFAAVDEDDLGRYCQTGRWHKRKPGLILALFNGYRNNYDVFLPLLERYGFVGWFFVATAFAGMPAAGQLESMARCTVKTVANEYSDGRYALNWGELQQVDRRHVVASHTRHHARLLSMNAESLEDEILGPQQDFERHLGHRARSFAALSGSAYGDNKAADCWIRKAGYQFVFSNFKIQSLWL